MLPVILAVALATSPVKLLPEQSDEVRQLRLELVELESTTRIQTLISIAVTLLLGVAIGTGAACFAVWNAPKTEFKLNVCGR